VVAGTGAGKTLVALLSATVAHARTTLFLLPMVALRGDMLRRCQQVGIRPLVWSVESRETAALVFVAVESACTEQFLDYAKGLALRQQLDRIIIDECHLTITASDYRPCMSQLGWHVRQVPAQTVWLTATLPPALQEEFIQQNKLVRPRVVRESTNRLNIKYAMSRQTGPGILVQKAATLAKICW
jgi:superfamily II DNA helicase RecQ